MMKTYSKQTEQLLCSNLFERKKALTMSDKSLLLCLYLTIASLLWLIVSIEIQK